MADTTLLFDDLLRASNLRARSYVVHEPPGSRMACVELSARRLDDWFFARRWVSINAGRRLLYWLLDDVESHGFRFRVSRMDRDASTASAPVEPWGRAVTNWEALTEEERRIHRDLFPHEFDLLQRGYDWDERRVYRGGLPLPVDPIGRLLEEDEGTVFEWVRVVEEWTWRRYPLHVVSRPMNPGAPASASAQPA